MQNDMNNVTGPWLNQINQVSGTLGQFLATAHGQPNTGATGAPMDQPGRAPMGQPGPQAAPAQGGRGAAPPAPSGFMEMVAPDGRALHVPFQDVGKMIAAGAKRKGGG